MLDCKRLLVFFKKVSDRIIGSRFEIEHRECHQRQHERVMVTRISNLIEENASKMIGPVTTLV